MPYIKLENALRIIDNVMSDEGIKHKGKAIRKRLKELPGEDVVEVVRCKDCMHSCVYKARERRCRGMTPQEAIEILEVNAICSPKATKFKESVEVAKKALEKQIPKKPEESYDGYADGNPVIDYHCPNCYREVDEDDMDHHCECGQALDWSDNNE